MRTITLALAIWMALLWPAGQIEAGWQINQDVNNTAGPGGNLQDLSSVDLTDCCGGVLFPR